MTIKHKKKPFQLNEEKFKRDTLIKAAKRGDIDAIRALLTQSTTIDLMSDTLDILSRNSILNNNNALLLKILFFHLRLLLIGPEKTNYCTLLLFKYGLDWKKADLPRENLLHLIFALNNELDDHLELRDEMITYCCSNFLTKMATNQLRYLYLCTRDAQLKRHLAAELVARELSAI